MKKLWLTLVFVLIAVMCLTFAVGAADAEKLGGLADVSKLYKADGSEIVGGGMNGGSYMHHLFDGGYGACYNNNVGSYIVTDLNTKLPGGYYVTEVKVYNSNNANFSVYYSKDGGASWIAVAENVKTNEGTYAIGDIATQVKYVFNSVPNWVAHAKEIEIYGINPADLSCTHANLSADAWTPVPGSATCTEVGKVSQACPDCGEVLEQVSNDVLPLGHNLITTVTRPGTSVSYGAATLDCSRCDYTIDFSGEVNLTNGTYSSIGESQQFVNILVSSLADLWGASRAENLIDGNWEEVGPFHTWVAAGEVDEDEYVLLDFQGEIDLTKIKVMVQNDSGSTLVISALNAETGEYEVVRNLVSYDETISNGGALVMEIPLLGVTTSSLKIQSFSNWKNANGYYYNRMVIGEIEAFGIAKGCGLDADNHECTFDTFVDYVVAPTCQEAGTATFKCACNATKVLEVAASEEFHNFVEIEGTRIDSTCSIAGKYTGKCSICEAEGEVVLELDENAHNYQETEKQAATCSAAGFVKYVCQNCNAEKTEELEQLAHTYGEAVEVPATCEAAGSKTWTCEVCGGQEVREIPALGHAWAVESIITEPTCGGKGEANYVCSTCNATKVDEVAATNNHNWDTENYVVVNNPTCEGTGYGTYTCLDCGTTKNDLIAALGHSWTEEVEGTRVPATCKNEGSVTMGCANCDKETIVKLAVDTVNGHDFVEVENAEIPTYKCSICGEEYSINNAAVNGEYFLGTDLVVFENGVLTVGETTYAYTYNTRTGMIDTDNEAIYFQVIDGKIYFKGAEQLHQHTADVYVAESQEDGGIVYVCQFCGDSYIINNAAINGEYLLGTDAVIFADGVLTAPFGTANYTYNVTTGMVDTDAAGIYFQVVDGTIFFKGAEPLHQHTDDVYVAEEQEDGSIVYTCKYCGDSYVISNFAIEGTYYLGVDEVVFADGKVTIFGEAFDYTYNATTGMIDVANAPMGAFFQVIDGKIYFKGAEPLHKHESLEFSGYVDGKAPTCAQGATAIYICQFCGEIEVEVEATGEHSYFAACDKICQVCGEETNPDATHTIIHVEAKAGTDCQTFDGNIEYWYCEVCGYAWADEALTLVTNRMSIPTNGAHSYFAACDKICQVCGEETNPDATHTIVHVEAKAGTDCQTFDGNVEYWYCSDCGSAWLNEELTLVTNLMSVKVAGAHGAYIEETVDATCDAPGSVTKICAVCMGVISTETIEATGHNYVAGEPVLPSCGNDGYTPYTCTNCGNVDKRDVVEAPEHDWFFTGYDPENMPTCDREGIANYVCLNCEETKTETALHRLTAFINYVEGKEPTCTEYGYAKFECVWCSEFEERKVAPAHNYEVTDSVAATCTEDGSQTFVCADCGDTYTEVVPARGHNFNYWYGYETIVEPTCTEEGQNLYTCYNCGVTETGVAEATGHNMVAGEPDFTAHTVLYTCANGCGTSETKSTYGMMVDPYTFAVPGSVTVNASEAYTFYLIQLPEGMSEGYLTLSFNTENSFTYLLDANDIYASQYGTRCEIQSDGKYLLGVSTNSGEEEIIVTATFEAATIPNAGEVPEKAITIEDTNTAYVGTGKVWYKFVDLMPGTVTFVIDVDATIKYGIFGWGETVTEDALITYTGAFENTDYNTYYICVESAEPFEFVVNVEEPVGSENNPLELVVGDNNVATAGGWSTYYAIFEATTAGTITFTYDAETYNNVVIYMGTNPYNVRTFVMSGEPIELEAGTYYLAIKTSDWSAVTFNLAVEFEAAQGPEIPEPDDEIGDYLETFEVETTDTYTMYNHDSYTYVALKAGKYTFFIPAGLGLWSDASITANPFGSPEVDYTSNPAGEWVTVELKANEEFKFWYSAETKDFWEIDVYYLAPAHTCDFSIPTERVESTCKTQGYVIYACSCGETKKEDLPLADHTEKVIPAIPGELRNPGMTSGVECSVCQEVLVAPVQASGDFRIGATSLNLGENVSIIYKAAVPAGYENVYMVFEMTVLEDGVEVVKTFKVEEYEIGADGRYWFTFSGIRLQYMADLVTATVYAEQDGIVSANSYSNYSVKSYITGQLAKATNSAELKTMLSDLLILGAKTQIYADYRADNLMTADVDASILTPSTYAGVPSEEFVQKMIVNDEATRAIADWKSVSLTFKDAMSLQFKLAIDPSKLDGIEIKVYVPVYDGTTRVDTYTAEDFTYSASEDRYILFVDNIKASQYGQTVVGEIYYNGEQISRTVNYSVNSYIQKNQDNANVALRDFLRAAYQYGLSVFDYAY